MTRIKSFSVTVCVLFLVLVNVGLGQQSSLEQAAAPVLNVGPGDLIEVTIYDNPDLSGHFRVDEKGDIDAPLLGPVHVEGKTAEQIGRAIEERYLEAEILPAPKDHATVFISEYASQGITVSGEVKSPGLFPALGVRMLHDLMTAAGGMQPVAASKVIITRKSDPEHPITVDYNPEALAPVIPRIQIFPGDTITVPKAGIVYIGGNVNRPGGYMLEGRNHLSLVEAMTLAGNTGHGADANQVHIVRTQGDGRKEDIIIRLDQVLKGKAADVWLSDGDILYVPTSNVRLATERVITAAIGIGSSVAIYKSAFK